MKVRVSRDAGLKRGDEHHPAGAVIEMEHGQELTNLIRSGKVRPHSIDDVLNQGAKTMQDQIDIDRAEAQGVLSGPVVSAEAETPAVEAAPVENSGAKKNKLTAKDAPKPKQSARKK